MTIHPFEGGPSVDVAGSVLGRSNDMNETIDVEMKPLQPRLTMTEGKRTNDRRR